MERVYGGEEMTTWFTEAEAAIYLKVPEEALKFARYRKKVKARKFCRVVQYMQEWLDDFREGKCAANQNSSNVTTLHSGSSMSHLPMDAEQRALVRARQIIAKQKRSLRNGSSKDANRKTPH